MPEQGDPDGGTRGAHPPTATPVAAETTTARASDPAPATPVARRQTLIELSAAAMAAGLAAGYGALALMAARYLYPARPAERRWTFLVELDQMKVGDSLVYRTPAGLAVSIARTGTRGTAGDFIALSGTCPHLGCQVHWEPQNNRFLCPCHNGTFDPTGRSTGGPPFEARQSLGRFPLRVEGAIVFIEVPMESLALGPGQLEPAGGPPGPGHDPCLFRRPRVASGRGAGGSSGSGETA
jgi:cytochrome b6-f complex iron-sulfur subunit